MEEFIDAENEHADERHVEVESDGADDTVPLSSTAAPETEEPFLSKKARVDMLRDHPVLAARLFEIRSRLLFWEVFNGADQPFGKISDFWGRVEFQGEIIAILVDWIASLVS